MIMEQIIILVSEAPFLVKLFIAYAMILILVFLGNSIAQLINSNYFKRDFFMVSIKLSFWILLISIFLTATGEKSGEMLALATYTESEEDDD